eukprot:TRINITY_DN2073_c0_g2_i4.p1 TRINITY_DN2073_c0_g2~~TRINITY_DN2073_c0_g2_i4.p1  ORF type:complete len:5484 (-),score=1034.41 TRINITY_DN2073_c0_g2_i4:293-16744(-)
MHSILTTPILCIYLAPVVTSVTEVTPGGGPVTISGTGFGATWNQVQVWFRGRYLSDPQWVSDTQITVTAPPGYGRNIPIIVEADGGASASIYQDMVHYLNFEEGAHLVTMDMIGPQVAILGGWNAATDGFPSKATQYTPTWSPGIHGTALHFDGVDDFAGWYWKKGESLVGYVSPAEFSFSVWVKIDTCGSSQQERWITGTGAVSNFHAMVKESGGSCVASFKWRVNGQPYFVSAEGTVDHPLGVWTHIALTSKAGGQVKIYKDGVVTDTFPASQHHHFFQTSESSSARRGIGGDPPSSWAYPNTDWKPFHGSIDEMRFYHRELTSAEVNAISPIPAASVLSYSSPDVDVMPMGPSTGGILHYTGQNYSTLLEPPFVTIGDSQCTSVIVESTTQFSCTSSVPEQSRANLPTTLYAGNARFHGNITSFDVYRGFGISTLPQASTTAVSPPVAVNISALPFFSVTLTPSAVDMTFYPASLTWTPSSPLEQTFRFLGTQYGEQTVSFTLQGPDSFIYTVPAAHKVWISQLNGQVLVSTAGAVKGGDTIAIEIEATSLSAGVTVTPGGAAGLSFQPASLSLAYPGVTKGTIQASAIGSGLQSVTWTLSGPDAAFLPAPPPSSILIMGDKFISAIEVRQHNKVTITGTGFQEPGLAIRHGRTSCHNATFISPTKVQCEGQAPGHLLLEIENNGVTGNAVFDSANVLWNFDGDLAGEKWIYDHKQPEWTHYPRPLMLLGKYAEPSLSVADTASPRIPQQVAGIYGQGLRFDGIDDYAAIPQFKTGVSYSVVDITIAAWVQVHACQGEKILWGKFYPLSGYGDMVTTVYNNASSGTCQLLWFKQGKQLSTAIEVGEWNHIMVSQNKTHMMMFVNNTLVSSSGPGGNLNQNTNLHAMFVGGISEDAVMSTTPYVSTATGYQGSSYTVNATIDHLYFGLTCLDDATTLMAPWPVAVVSPPRISALTPAPWTSGISVTITGNNFGPDATTIGGHVGGLALASVTWQQDSSLVVQLPPAPAINSTVTISVLGSPSLPFAVTHAPSPSIAVPTIPTLGINQVSPTLDLVASSLVEGKSVTVTPTAPDCTFNPSSVLLTPSGLNVGSFTVQCSTVGYHQCQWALSGEHAEKFQAVPPSAILVLGDYNVTWASSQPSLLLRTPSSDWELAVQYMQENKPLTLTPSAPGLIFTPTSQVLTYQQYPWTVSFAVEGVVLGASTITVAMAGADVAVRIPPLPLSVEVINFPSLASTTAVLPAGGPVTITGKYFGTTTPTPTPTVKIGSQDCGSVSWISDTTMTCQAPAGTGNGHIVNIKAGGLTTVPLDGVKLLFNFDEGAGIYVKDGVDLKPGTIKGGAQFLSQYGILGKEDSVGSNSARPTWVAGKNGAALDFDGVDDFVYFPIPMVMAFGSKMTMSAWVNVKSCNPQGSLIMGSQADGVFDQFPDGGGWQLVMKEEGGSCYAGFLFHTYRTTAILWTDVPTPVNTWVHLAAAWGGKERWLYQDGVQVLYHFDNWNIYPARQDMQEDFDDYGTNLGAWNDIYGWYVGGTDYAPDAHACFHGTIDEVAIFWDTERSHPLPSNSFAYVAPVISGITAISAGGGVVTITGANFGSSSSSRVDTVVVGTDAVGPGGTWVSDSIVHAVLPPGPAGPASVRLLIEGQASAPLAFTYLPQYSFVVPAMSELDLGVPTSLSFGVTGAPDTSVSLTPACPGITFSPPVITFTDASSQSVSATGTTLGPFQVTFSVSGPSAVGFTSPAAVAVAVRQGDSFTDPAYPASLILGQLSAYIAINVTRLLSDVTITPQSNEITFEPARLTFVAGQPWSRLFRMRAHTAGVATINYVLSGSEAGSKTGPTAGVNINVIAAPVVTAVTPAPSTGGPITISGSNFGSTLADVWAYVGIQPCPVTQLFSPTLLECTAPPGFGANILLTVGVAPSNISNNPAFDPDHLQLYLPMDNDFDFPSHPRLSTTSPDAARARVNGLETYAYLDGSWNQRMLRSPGKYGNAMHRTASLTSMNFQHGVHLNGRAQMTLQFWVYLEEPYAYSSADILQHGYQGSNGFVFQLERRIDPIDGSSRYYYRFAVKTNTSPYTPNVWASCNEEAVMRTWTHIAGVYDGNYLYLYINGLLAGQSALTGTLSMSASAWNPPTFSSTLKGRLDEVIMYDRALAPEELSWDPMWAQFSYIAPNITGHSFITGAGGTLTITGSNFGSDIFNTFYPTHYTQVGIGPQECTSQKLMNSGEIHCTMGDGYNNIEPETRLNVILGGQKAQGLTHITVSQPVALSFPSFADLTTGVLFVTNATASFKPSGDYKVQMQSTTLTLTPDYIWVNSTADVSHFTVLANHNGIHEITFTVVEGGNFGPAPPPLIVTSKSPSGTLVYPVQYDHTLVGRKTKQYNLGVTYLQDGLSVKLESAEMTIHPNVFHFQLGGPWESPVSFTLHRSGEHQIKYTLYGPDAGYYATPGNSTIQGITMPIITSSTVVPTQGGEVTITGENFEGGAGNIDVTINDINCTNPIVGGTTVIKCGAPPGTGGDNTLSVFVNGLSRLPDRSGLVLHLPLDVKEGGYFDKSGYRASGNRTHGPIPFARTTLPADTLPLGLGYFGKGLESPGLGTPWMFVEPGIQVPDNSDFTFMAYLRNTLPCATWSSSGVTHYREKEIAKWDDFRMYFREHFEDNIKYCVPRFDYQGSVLESGKDASIGDKQWRHYAWVVKGNSMSIVVDGVTVASRSISKSHNFHFANNYNVGPRLLGTPGSNYPGWTGQIDDIRLYARALGTWELPVIPEYDRLQYAAPTLTSATEGPSQGGSITIIGINFGDVDIPVTVSIGGEECSNAQWQSSTTITCDVAAGEGAGIPITAMIVNTPAVSSVTFTYAAPNITHFTPTPALGGTVTLTGQNFGITAKDLPCTIAGTPALPSFWISDSLAICTAPAGTGSGLVVAVTVNGRQSSASSVLFDYTPAQSINMPFIPDISVGETSPPLPINITTFPDLVTVDLTLSGPGLTFNPSVLTFTSGVSQTFTITPSTSGRLAVTASASAGVSSRFYVSPVTTYGHFQGDNGFHHTLPTTIAQHVNTIASITVHNLTSDVTLTPSGTGLTFTPTTLTFTYDSDWTQTVQVSGSIVGTHALSFVLGGSETGKVVPVHSITVQSAPYIGNITAAPSVGGVQMYQGASFGLVSGQIDVSTSVGACGNPSLTSPDTIFTCTIPAGVGPSMSTISVNGFNQSLALAALDSLYTFSEQAGLISYDVIPGSPDHILLGSTTTVLQTWNGETPYLLTSPTGAEDGAIRFQNNQIASIKPNHYVLGDEYSLLMRVRIGSCSSTHTLFAKVLPGPNLNRGVYLALKYNGTHCTCIGSLQLSTGISPTVSTLTYHIPTVAWTTIALTYRSGALSLYVDGQLDSSVYATGTVAQSSGPDHAPVIGRLPDGSQGLHGDIDTIAIFRRALDASALQAWTDPSIQLYKVWHYQAPNITSVTPTTPLGAIITVSGSNFGAVASPIAVHVQGAYCHEPTWLSPGDIRCIAPALAASSNNNVEVIVAGQSSGNVSILTSSYDPVTVTSVTRAPTSGGVITVMGANFGVTAPSSVGITVGGSACASPQWIDAYTATCTAPAGFGAGHSLVMTLDSAAYPGPGSSSSANTLFSYALPALSSASAGSPLGGTITLTGANFGSTPSPVLVTVDGQPCTSPAWLSSTLITCSLAPQLPAIDLATQVTLGGQTSLAYPLVTVGTFLPVTLSSAAPAANTQGSAITIVGVNFGGSASAGHSASVGGSACSTVTYLSPTQLLCQAPPGMGLGLAVSVTVGNPSIGYASSAVPVPMNYAAPTITAATPAVSSGSLITISGDNLGFAGAVVNVTVGNSLCTSPLVISAHAVTCSAPAGSGQAVTVWVDVAGQTTSANVVSYVPSPPSLTLSTATLVLVKGSGLQVLPNFVTSSSSNFTTTALSISYLSGDLDIIGGALPSLLYTLAVPTTTASLSINATDKEGAVTLQVTATYTPTFTLPAATVLVLVQQRQAPVVSALVPTQMTACGGQLKVVGLNYVQVQSVTVGSGTCSNVRVLSSTELLCDIPVGLAAGAVAVNVTTVRGTGSSSIIDLYLQVSPRPVITAILPSAEVPALRGGSITVQGSNFGSSANAIQAVTFNDLPVSPGQMQWQDANTLVLELPKLDQFNQTQLVVTNGEGCGNIPYPFTFTGPRITTVEPSFIDLKNVQQERISITGNSFQGVGTVSVFLGSIPCSSVVLQSARTLTCLPEASPIEQTVVVTVVSTLGGRSRENVVFSFRQLVRPGFTFPVPIVESISPDKGSIRGGDSVTIRGRYLGEDLYDLAFVWIGNATCNVGFLSWKSSNEFTCVTSAVPDILNANITVETRSGGQGHSRAPMFAYIHPTPTIVGGYPRVGRQAGGDRLTILGSEFGDTKSNDLKITMGQRPCARSEYISSSTVVCITRPQSDYAPGNPLLVTVGHRGQVTTPQDLDFRYVPDGQLCEPPCGFHGDCEGDSRDNPICQCRPGYTNPPDCIVELVSLEFLTPQFTTEDAGAGTAANDVLVVRVTLSQAPQADVSITWNTTAPDQVEIIQGGEMTFTPASYNQGQILRLAGKYDSMRDGDHDFKIVSLPIVSDDSKFSQAIIETHAVASKDAAPKIAKSGPELSPLNGTYFAALLNDVDVDLKITAGGQSIDHYVFITQPRYEILRGGRPSPGLLAFADALAGNMSNATWTPFKLQQQQQQQQGITGVTVSAVAFWVPPTTQTGYQTIKITNPNRLTVTRDVFMTDDCPEPGSWGRGADCKPCPEGAVCPGGYRLWPKPGFWAPTEGSGFVYKCTPAEACIGGQSAECAPGYQGEFCGQCQPGFYRANGAECRPCPLPEQRMGYVVADVIVFSTISIITIFARSNHVVGFTMQFFMALQLVGGIGRMMPTSIPAALKDTFEFLHLVSGDYSFVKPNCERPAQYHVLYGVGIAYHLVKFLPMIIGVYLVGKLRVWWRRRKGLYIATVNLTAYNKGGSPEDGYSSTDSSSSHIQRVDDLVTAATRAPALIDKAYDDDNTRTTRQHKSIADPIEFHYRTRFRRACITALFLSYMQLCRSALQTLACVRVVEGGPWLLRVDKSVRCTEAVHLIVGAISFLGLISYGIMFPVLYTWYVHKKGHAIEDNPEIASSYDVLTEPFKFHRRYFFWAEFAIIAAISIGDSFANDSPIAQFILVGGTILSTMIATVLLTPYDRWWEMLIMQILNVATLLAAAYNWVLRDSILDESQTDGILYSLVLAVVTVTLGWLVISLLAALDKLDLGNVGDDDDSDIDETELKAQGFATSLLVDPEPSPDQDVAEMQEPVLPSHDDDDDDGNEEDGEDNDFWQMPSLFGNGIALSTSIASLSSWVLPSSESKETLASDADSGQQQALEDAAVDAVILSHIGGAAPAATQDAAVPGVVAAAGSSGSNININTPVPDGQARDGMPAAALAWSHTASSSPRRAASIDLSGPRSNAQLSTSGWQSVVPSLRADSDSEGEEQVAI